jgi:prepilin peptidase CpaA
LLPSPIVAVVLAFVTVCVVTDVRARRIPNAISAPAMLLGALLNGAYFGIAGLAGSAAGIGVAILVLFFPFALGGIGAGDVKMMAAVGALLGMRLMLVSLLVGMLLGGVVMLAYLARAGRLREKVAATARMVAVAAMTRSTGPLRLSAAAPEAVALPYSIPLALGTAAVLVAYLSGLRIQ